MPTTFLLSPGLKLDQVWQGVCKDPCVSRGAEISHNTLGGKPILQATVPPSSPYSPAIHPFLRGLGVPPHSPSTSGNANALNKRSDAESGQLVAREMPPSMSPSDPSSCVLRTCVADVELPRCNCELRDLSWCGRCEIVYVAGDPWLPALHFQALNLRKSHCALLE
jgi:hypothetical protein